MAFRFLIAILASALPTFGPLLCGFMCRGACGQGPAPSAAACCAAPVQPVSCCGPAACGSAATCDPAAPFSEPCCQVCPCDEPAPVPAPATIPGGLDLPVAILSRPWPAIADDLAGVLRLTRRVAPVWSPGSGNPLQSVLCVWLN